MDKEKKQEYSTRIVQANRTELLVIVYELLQEDLKHALIEYERQDIRAFDAALKSAQKFLHELMGTLNYQYELSFRLLSIYKFINKVIIRDRLQVRDDELKSCIGLIERIHDAYAQISSEDREGPVMKNVQQVYAGLTYGKHALSEVSMDESDGHRGLYA